MNEGSPASVRATADAPYAAGDQDSSLRDFLARLEAAAEAGQVELPAWSKVTERARTALGSAAPDNDELARLLGADAGLAVRVLSIANSAMFTRGGRPLSDLKLAILRIGHDNLRSAVYSYALAQLRQAPRLQRLRPLLHQLWSESTHVAAFTRLVVVRVGDEDTDISLLTGLLHNIGKLYIHVRLADGEQGPLPARPEQLLNWHARIGSAVARGWRLPLPLCDAIAGQDQLQPDAGRQSTLSAALSAAVIASTTPAPASEAASHLAAFGRFGLAADEWVELIERACSESAALRATFGD